MQEVGINLKYHISFKYQTHSGVSLFQCTVFAFSNQLFVNSVIRLYVQPLGKAKKGKDIFSLRKALLVLKVR